MKKERPQPPRIIWHRPDFPGAAMHGFRKTGEGTGKRGEALRIYTSLCGAVVLHRGERLSGHDFALQVARVYDAGVCAECQRRRLDDHPRG